MSLRVGLRSMARPPQKKKVIVTLLSDGFETFPTGWTTGTGGTGTITKSSTQAHGGTYRAKVYSPVDSAIAYAYRGVTRTPGTLVYDIWIWIDSSVKPSDFNYLIEMYDTVGGGLVFDLGYKWNVDHFTATTKNAPFTPEVVGTLASGQWVHVVVSVNQSTGKADVYFDDVYQGQFTIAGGTTKQTNRLYFGDTSAGGQSAFFYYDDLLLTA